MCKSHLMIAIYSEWRPLLFTCLLWARPFIFEKSGRVAKTEKTNHAREKEENKFVHKEAWDSMGRLNASPTYFWYLYNSHTFSPIRMKIVE